MIYDRTGAYVGQLSPGTDFQPTDVGVSADGAVYALDQNGTLVHRFDAAGRYTALRMPYDSSGIRADNFAVQSDGTFWLLYRHGLVEHRDRAGALMGAFTVPIEGLTPGLAAAPDGHLFVGRLNGGVREYSPSGSLVRTLDVPGDSRLSIAPDGDLVTSVSDTRVDVLGPDGAYRRTLNALDRDYIHSIAVDDAGRMYAGLGDRVAILDRNGGVVGRFGEAGTGVGQFDGTRLGVLGDVLTIAERGNNRVTRVRIDPSAPGPPEPSSYGMVYFDAKTIAVRGARAQVPLACVGRSATACAGSVTLLRSSVKARGRLKRKDVLANAPFRVGRSGVVALKLKRAQRRTLSRKRKVKVQLLVVSKQGGPIFRRVTLKLRTKAKATPKKKAKTARR
jgi:hypothetical protein